MSRTITDLGMLTRARVKETAPGAIDAPPGPVEVPPPRARWKTRVLLPAALLAAAGGLFAHAARDWLRPATPVRVVPVVVRAVQGVPGGAGGEAPAGAPPGSSATVQAPGWVEPDPFPVAVSALTDGVAKDVLVLEGQPVKAGQVVLRMVDDDARLAVARAEADVAVREGELGVAKAALAAAQGDWDNPVERKRAVASGDAMLAEATAELDRHPLEIEAEQARADELAEIARRTEAKAAQNSVTGAELVQARERLKGQRAVLASTKAKRPVLAAKVARLAADAEAAREEAKLRIAERKALDQAAAAVRQAEAAHRQSCVMCEEAHLRLRRTEVRAPSDGVVLARLVEPGSKLMLSGTETRSAQVLRLYDPKKLQVRVDVPIADAGHVGVGQAAKVVVGVLPDRAFDGVVTRVVHEADIQRNTLQVKVAIKDPSPELKPEMLARVRFLAMPAMGGIAGAGVTTAPSTSQQVFAPERLLQRGGDSTHARAWVVDKGRGVAVLRTVTLAEGRFEGWVAVASGLQPGDALIAGDTSRLSEGERVRLTGEEEDAGADANTSAGATMKGGDHAAH